MELLKNPSFELDKAGNPIPLTPGGFTSFNAPPGQEIVKGWLTADPTLNNTVEIEGNPYGGGIGIPPLHTVDGQHMVDMAATNPNAAGGTRMDLTQQFSTSAAQLVNIDLLYAQQQVGSLHTPNGDHLIVKLDSQIIFNETVQTADPAAWNHMLDAHASLFLGAGAHTLEMEEVDSSGSLVGNPFHDQPLVGFAVDLLSVHTAIGPG